VCLNLHAQTIQSVKGASGPVNLYYWYTRACTGSSSLCFCVVFVFNQISELQRQHELIRLSGNSLTKMHQKAVQLCKQNDEQLTGSTLVDGRYTHLEVGGRGQHVAWLCSI